LFESVGAFHSVWGWATVGILAAAGVISIVTHLLGRFPEWLKAVLAVGFAAALLQVVAGVWAFAVDGIQPGNQHVFYGVVTAFTLAFAYTYRTQFARKPALYYGLVMLFMMGLGLRGIMTFGNNFG